MLVSFRCLQKSILRGDVQRYSKIELYIIELLAIRVKKSSNCLSCF